MKFAELKPLNKLKSLRPETIYTFDVETTSTGFFKLVCIGVLRKSRTDKSKYETKTHTFFEFSEFVEYLFDENIQKIFCYNIKFDSRFFANYLYDNKDSINFYFIQSKSQLLGLVLTKINTKEKIVIKDFLPFCLCTLDEISTKMKTSCKKYPANLKTKNEWENFFTTCNLIELEKHCVNDVLITCEVIYKYRKLIFEKFHVDLLNKRIFSLATLTMKVFRSNYLSTNLINSFVSLDYNKERKRFKYHLNSQIYDFIRKSYKGGYCGNTSNKLFKNVVSFDINSSYPYQATILKFPIGRGFYTEDEQIFNELTKEIHGFAHVIVDFIDPIYYIPVIRSDKKFGREYGLWDGYLTTIEINYLKKHQIPVKFVEGYYFVDYDKSYSLKEFMLSLYSLKKECSDSDPYREIYKRFLNALTGKFGQKVHLTSDMDTQFITKEELEELDEPPEFSIQLQQDKEMFYAFNKVEKESIKTFTIPSWISLITASARIQLIDMIIKTKAIYFDSDSVYCEEKNVLNFITSDKLGGWKLEHRCLEFRAIAPKLYCFKELIKNKELEFIKAKGVPRNLYNHELYEKIRDWIPNTKIKILGIKRFISFKEALHRKNVLLCDNLIKYDISTKTLNPNSKY